MSLSIVILAAGKGTRMHSNQPKVLHTLAAKPLILHVIDTALLLSPDTLGVVYGSGAQDLLPLLDKKEDIQLIKQQEQHGTGHAVRQAIPLFSTAEQVLVLYGDVPLIQATTLKALLNCGSQQSLRLLTAQLDDPTGYGRIVRNQHHDIVCITEQKDADEKTLAIREVSTGMMAMPATWLAGAVTKLNNNNAQGEYYLTDMVELAVKDGLTINTICCQNNAEVSGVNTRKQLAKLERYYQQTQADSLMKQGVTLIDPDRLDIRGTLTTGVDTVIDINVIIEGEVTLGDKVNIGANCIIKNSIIGNNSTILPNSIIESSQIGQYATIGPFARLRPDTQLADNIKIGNFVETKNAQVGDYSKINHLSYIGDAKVGNNVNIGAGTITCNYDGANKNQTNIGDDVFIGSDSQLVAPITIEQGATIGAGTTLRKDAPENALTLTETQQKSIPNWRRPTKKYDS